MKAKLATMAALAILLFTQCKKETATPILDEKTAFLEKAQQFVKTATPAADFGQLDWGKAIAYKKDSAYKMVRVPLWGNTQPGQKAVYLSYNNGRFSGNYFELSNNTVTTLSLDNVRKCVAPVTGNGQVRDYMVYENGQQLQDVTVMAAGIMRPPMYIYGDFNLYYLMGMLGLGQNGVGGDVNITPQGTASYLEAPLDGSELGGGGGNGEIIEVDYADIEAKTAVSIVKLFNCFDEVPDLPNTEYEIILNVDVPVNAAPTAPYDLLYNPGHVFITITKTYQFISVKQNFGFYPNSGISSVLNTYTSSKIVHDEWHEVNGKVKMNINQQQFSSIKTMAITAATQDYSLEYNNCTDFALKLFNIGRPGNPITLPPFLAFADIPPVTLSKVINNAPQTLFAWLKASKAGNTSDAPNITFTQSLNAGSGASKGECN